MSLEINESAVSESIGVILMVALTVVMGAIIAVNMFGMVQGIPQTRTIVVTVDQQPDGTHLLTYRGGPDQFLLNSLTIVWPDGTEESWSPMIGYQTPLKNVTAGKNHVLVTGHFQNNINQVVLDTWI